MKKQILIVGLLLLTLNLFSQKLKSPLVDKISGDTTWITSSEKLFAKASFSGTVGEQLYVSVGKTKDIYLLFFSVQTGKSSVFSVEEGQKVYIKLKNDTVVTLVNIQNTVSKSNAISYGSNSNSYYQITNHDIEKFSSSNVQFIRIEHSDGIFEYDIKEKFSEAIKSLVLLIKQK